MGEKLKIGVLGSGSGSNAQSIIDAIEAGALDAEVVCVLTDVEDARILERAATHGIPGRFISAAPFKTKLDGAAETEYIRVLQAHGATCVVLAGFMRIVKPAMLKAFPQRVLNIHPALLPAFPGMASWKQALEYGTRVAGCTVHFVDEGTDTGPIIVQRCVPVEPGDTPETLHARIQIEEHLAYPEALRLLAAGRLNVVGRRVEVREGEVSSGQ
ncbi:MAG: phosphoribosylglycinamide formyltransferase [Verrucomicrobia bacterium]|jgi:phosphoribosylglycinamide formyltransferase 1|nr:phosphoribosylglycinamide formyltransferase [Verrucomicrobiota bacterium]MBT7700020.1 phosphoribosylglycinamide formyltransferase [Verrucomicrobiota bacterium]